MLYAVSRIGNPSTSIEVASLVLDIIDKVAKMSPQSPVPVSPAIERVLGNSNTKLDRNSPRKTIIRIIDILFVCHSGPKGVYICDKLEDNISKNINAIIEIP